MAKLKLDPQAKGYNHGIYNYRDAATIKNREWTGTYITFGEKPDMAPDGAFEAGDTIKITGKSVPSQYQGMHEIMEIGNGTVGGAKKIVGVVIDVPYADTLTTHQNPRRFYLDGDFWKIYTGAAAIPLSEYTTPLVQKVVDKIAVEKGIDPVDVSDQEIKEEIEWTEDVQKEDKKILGMPPMVVYVGGGLLGLIALGVILKLAKVY